MSRLSRLLQKVMPRDAPASAAGQLEFFTS